MSQINTDGLPVFDAEYFERKNSEANMSKQEKNPQGLGNGEQTVSVEMTRTEVTNEAETTEEEFEFELEKYEDPDTNFAKVMEFYYRFLNDKAIPDELKRQMIFYGGTLPYAILEKKPKQYKVSHYRGHSTARYFKDVDIFVPIKALKDIRNMLASLKDFRMRSDSADLFVRNKESAEAKATAEQVYNKIYHRDFGFNSILYGMPISVHPIFEENGNINSRGFRVGYENEGLSFPGFSCDDEEIDTCDWMTEKQSSQHEWSRVLKYPDYLLETALVSDYSLVDFITQTRILGKDINIATLEFTIVSKLLARQRGYTRRTVQDSLDLDFINEHADSLGINPNKLELLKQKVLCNIIWAYDIRNGQVEQEIDGNEYSRRLRLERIKTEQPWT